MVKLLQRLDEFEDADVVQSQETALKDVVSLAVLAVHPPGKVEQEFVEHPLQEVTVSLPSSVHFSILDTRQAAEAWTGGFTSPNAHS